FHLLVTLPLALVAWLFPFVWPVAVSSMLLSLGVSAAAAVQAEIPPAKRRLWSRPLVVLLFLLQPVSRGLARYRSRLAKPSGSRLTRVQDASPALVAQRPEILGYWSKGGVDRYRFIAAL